ncbi:hypothetical protein [Alkalihalobacillus trypoxylicola]|nr:hypothetical protein [Alkalihalobacillus trypoxylicola]
MSDWFIFITILALGSIASLFSGKRTKYQVIIWGLVIIIFLTVYFFF